VRTIDLSLLERIAQQRRFEERTLEIAKRLFVHGETPKRLSVEYGVNIQRVYAIRKEVLAAAQALELPPGWEEITVRGPKELIEQVRRLVAGTREQDDSPMNG
jgi:hypothetical protein